MNTLIGIHRKLGSAWNDRVPVHADEVGVYRASTTSVPKESGGIPTQ